LSNTRRISYLFERQWTCQLIGSWEQFVDIQAGQKSLSFLVHV